MEKYSETYEVRTYECDSEKRLGLLPLFNLMQGIATKHANIIGVGYDVLAEKGGYWVYTAYDIKILRRPTWLEKIVLTTWPSDNTALTCFREIQVSSENGEPLINASSQFAVLDMKRHRPMPVSKFFSDSYQPIQERLVDTTFPKLPDLTHIDVQKEIPVRYEDIDVNQHVNNAVYPVVAIEALPFDFLKTHEMSEIKIAFKKSAVYGDVMVSKAAFDGDVTTHSIVAGDDGREFTRIQMTWNEK